MIEWFQYTVRKLQLPHCFAASRLVFYIGCMQQLTCESIRHRFQLEYNRISLSIDGYHRAAVLVPLFLENGSIHLLLTKRTDLVETHKGQVSFPGGMVDATDTDVVHTALREAEEEIGLPRSSVEPLGLLDDLATPTGFVITPVVGFIHTPPPLVANTDEVAEIFHVPLDFFVDQNAGRTERREFKGKSYDVWFYTYGHHLIWGATAMIIRSLLKRLSLI